ncbi:MAG: hypothetical protein EHM58_02095 [Ignavibacteriae bacterium]|nr:MAG: hypothetical protein EHM58_02095 [Ignavibacteriota bacterium]
MKNIIYLILFFFISFCLNTFSQAQNIDIKGQVIKYNKFEKSNVPFNKVTLALYKLNTQDKSWILISKTISDENGEFYFYDVPVGEYYIQVNKKKNFKINVIPIDKSKYDYLELPVLKYK